MEIAAIISLATAAIGMITQKDKNKGLELGLELKELKEAWYEEYNKPENERSNMSMDITRRKLLICADTVASTATKLSAA